MSFNFVTWLVKLVIGFFVLMLAFSCHSPSNQTKEEETISKKIIIYADDICKEILEAEKTVFESQNPNANLQIVYGDEHVVTTSIFQDSARLVCLTRPLNSGEVKYIQSKSYSTKSIKIAEDAIVLIANNHNLTNTIVWDSLSGMLQKGNKNEKIVFVIDKNQSGHLKYLAQRTKIVEDKMNIYAVEDSVRLFEYIRSHDNAIALVPLSWVENILLKNTVAEQSKMKIISITNTERGEEVMPDQYHLSNGTYPLSKGVYLNLKGNVADDAANFVNFCMKDVGQLIVLKMGLLPVDMPSRAYYVK